MRRDVYGATFRVLDQAKLPKVDAFLKELATQWEGSFKLGTSWWEDYNPFEVDSYIAFLFAVMSHKATKTGPTDPDTLPSPYL